MKIVVIVVAVLACQVAQNVGKATSPKNNMEEQNTDIMTVLVGILNRMDKMDERMKVSADAATRLENTVYTNAKILNQLASQNQKLSQLVKGLARKDDSQDKKITNNTKNLDTIAAQNGKLRTIVNIDLKAISHDVAELKGLLSKGEHFTTPLIKFFSQTSFLHPVETDIRVN